VTTSFARRYIHWVNKAARSAAIREYALRMRWVSHVMERPDAVGWQKSGPAALLAVGDSLRRSAQQRHPDWPSTDDQIADIRHHETISHALRRVPRRRRR
jgi:hypothetical protein